jgi:hypothetical protein
MLIDERVIFQEDIQLLYDYEGMKTNLNIIPMQYI